MQRLATKLIVGIPSLVALFPYVLYAQTGGLPKQIVPCNGVDCGCKDLITLAQNIINTGIFLAIFLSAMLFAYAGWLYLTNEAIGEQARAKSMFTNVTIGLIVILAAWLVVDTLMEQLLKDNVTWNNICESLKFN